MKMARPSVLNHFNTSGIKVQSQELNFAFSFRPIYYFSRVFGLMPFSIVYDSNGDPQVPRVGIFDLLWFVISICIYLPFVYYCYKQLAISNDQSVPILFLLGAYILQMLDLIYGVLIIGIDMYNRFKLVGILKKITAFDKEVDE